MAGFIATPTDGHDEDLSSQGVYAVPDIGWFARRQSWSRGPFGTRELAERELLAMAQYEPGLAESWIALSKVVASGLLWTAVLLAAVLLLINIALIVHSKTGLF